MSEFEDFVSDAPSISDVDERPAFALQLEFLSAAERNRVLLDLVHEQTISILRNVIPDAPDVVDTERAFLDLGFDSLAAVELHDRLVEAVGQELPITVAFDHPTPAKLARYLLAEVLGMPADEVTRVRAALVDDEPIAIIGIGCRYPGGVLSPEDLWQLLANGVDAVSEFPTDRGWDLEGLFDPDPDRPGTVLCARGWIPA